MLFGGDELSGLSFVYAAGGYAHNAGQFVCRNLSTVATSGMLKTQRAPLLPVVLMNVFSQDDEKGRKFVSSFS